MVSWNVPLWEEDDEDRPADAPPQFIIAKLCREILANRGNAVPYGENNYVSDHRSSTKAPLPQPPKSLGRDHDITYHGSFINRCDNDWWMDQIGAR